MTAPRERYNEVTVGMLRRTYPAWTWRAEHFGMGYRYFGERDGQAVEVYAVSVSVGDGGEEFRTSWQARVGDDVDCFWSWSSRERLAARRRVEVAP